MKTKILIIALLCLTSCGQVKRNVAALTGYSTLCIEGVTYYQFTSGVTVAYNVMGQVKPCKR